MRAVSRGDPDSNQVSHLDVASSSIWSINAWPDQWDIPGMRIINISISIP